MALYPVLIRHTRCTPDKKENNRGARSSQGDASRLEFTGKALDELDDAAAWNREHNVAQGQRFLAAEKESADIILADPPVIR